MWDEDTRETYIEPRGMRTIDTYHTLVQEDLDDLEVLLSTEDRY